MKKLHRLSALVLALVLAMSVTLLPAAAAAPDAESGITTKTYDLGNDIVVVVTTAPNDITPMPLHSDRVLEALADPTASYTFYLERGEGPNCRANVWNDSTDGTAMDATFEISGLTSITERIPANSNTNFFAYDKQGNDLTGKAVINIKAVNAPSVRYTILIEQY